MTHATRVPTAPASPPGTCSGIDGGGSVWVSPGMFATRDRRPELAERPWRRQDHAASTPADQGHR